MFGVSNLPDGRQAGLGHLRVWDFEFWSLYDICDLLFVISGKEIPIQSS
jgi:hypothetical protein